MAKLIIYDKYWNLIQEVESEHGKRLFIEILKSGVDILNKCATRGTCAHCIVEFREGEPTIHTQAEQKLIFKWLKRSDNPKLSSEVAMPNVRASCQIKTERDMHFKVLYLESENPSIKRSDKAPSNEIEPEPVWVEGVLSRVALL
ncbi:MAG: hypothetical protein ACC656_00075 [Candidatus Heimdallarchaeota archaeon]